ncbi:Uncharacterized protein APZ42_034038 [Daphnia magna]|uniref:Uncharacterized protein n=1 Tax=Daphnia magna TaxID=35525 RepID=A0A164KI29_9CRUS|nr:Uncharacterized protein APZ42_034038 [Daphnia magna]
MKIVEFALVAPIKTQIRSLNSGVIFANHFCKWRRGKLVNLDFLPRLMKGHPDSALIAFSRGGVVNPIMANRGRSLGIGLFEGIGPDSPYSG